MSTNDPVFALNFTNAADRAVYSRVHRIIYVPFCRQAKMQYFRSQVKNISLKLHTASTCVASENLQKFK